MQETAQLKAEEHQLNPKERTLGYRNSSRETTTANLQEESSTLLLEAQDEVTKLREQLQLAEMQESSCNNSCVTEHPLNENEDGPSLSSTLAAEVCVEGQPTRALLDTGSPVSIISIDFLLQALLNLNNKRLKLPKASSKLLL